LASATLHRGMASRCAPAQNENRESDRSQLLQW
jgi:hypothetical protein